MAFDAGKKAEEIEELAQQRLDTTDATKGQEIQNKLHDELLHMDPSQRRAVLTELKNRYDNHSWDTLPVPKELVDERGVVVGIGFRASHLDFKSGPGSFDTLLFGTEPKSAYEPKSEDQDITNVKWDRYTAKIISQDISAKDGTYSGHEEFDPDTGKIKSRDITKRDGSKEHHEFDPNTGVIKSRDITNGDGSTDHIEFDADGRMKLYEGRNAWDGQLARRQEFKYDLAAGIQSIDTTDFGVDGSRTHRYEEPYRGHEDRDIATGLPVGQGWVVEDDPKTGKPKEHPAKN